jgi:hypothetical protein
LTIVQGCISSDHVKNIENKNFELDKLNKQLERQLKESEAENNELQKQLATLSELDHEKRINSLYKLETVKLAKYTNFYDKDKDGTKEKLIVYIQPIDTEGDLIKAAGSVEVELWDLSQESKEALLAKWETGPDELKKMWYATVVNANFRLVFDATDIIGSLKGPFTVKMTFTDYVSGKVYVEQKMVNL